MINKISAKIILDSVNPWGDRLTTVEVYVPRIIWPEILTYRVFSRGSASSRAIPLSKQISRIMEDPFVPKVFMANKPGMQAAEPLPIEEQEIAKKEWLQARDAAVYRAEKLGKMNIHKQWASRLLEPFMWHTGIISSTSWQNFFDQRCSDSGMAQPEMMELADAMRDALRNSKPVFLKKREWHMPYLREEDESLDLPTKLKVSTARAARVSYLSQNGVRSIDDDIKLWDRLKVGKHLSPLEHVSKPDSLGSGNFDGWRQLRYYAENDRLGDLGL